MRKARTPGQARKLLADYERLNKDLPKDTRRQMGLFYLAFRVSKKVMFELFGDLGQTQWRHRAWFWYNAMRLSGLEQHWDELAERRNSGEDFQDILIDLRDKIGKQEWQLLGKRIVGPGRFKPSRFHGRSTTTIWTRGGTWWRSNSFTKLLVLKQHLEPRPLVQQTHKALGHEGVRAIEKELMAMSDPDSMLVPDLMNEAVRYVRYRIPEYLGYDYPRSGHKMASWFFREPIPTRDDKFVDWYSDTKLEMRLNNNNWRWRWEW